MAQIRPLADYPTSFGNVRASIFGHAGPASYTQVTATAGTIPATGGDSVGVAEAGLKYFDLIVCCDETDDAAFAVEAFPLTSSNVNSAAGLGGIPKTTFGLRWISRVTATVGGQAQVANTEAVAGTNLSAEVVRLMAFGPK